MRHKIVLLVAKLLGVKVKIGKMCGGHMVYVGSPPDELEESSSDDESYTQQEL